MNKTKLLMIAGALAALTSAAPVWANTAGASFQVKGTIDNNTCSVEPGTAEFQQVTPQAVTNGTAVQKITLRVTCTGVQGSPSSMTFGSAGQQVYGDANAFAFHVDGGGAIEDKLDTAATLEVDGNQTAVWGANATNQHQIAPGADLLTGANATQIASGATHVLDLAVKLVPGYVGSGTVPAVGHDLTQDIVVNFSY
jgi:type 1 fimbria pilin